MKDKFNSKVIGLDAGLLIGKFFMDTEELHYGYWPNDRAATALNFSEAQDRHSQLIIDNIPEGIKKILDVGSGSGSLAKKMVSLGYQVDCVIPSEFLAEKVQQKLDASSKIHITKFEDLDISNNYDLILFSESFQYVHLIKSIDKILSILDKNGYLLICDVFHKNVSGVSPMRGGHRLDLFENEIEKTDLIKKTDIDITLETAPTWDFLNQFLNEVAIPISDMSHSYMKYKYPKLIKFIKWKYRNRLEKIRKVWLSNELTGENFAKFKSYRLFLYKK
tara:strand:- start:1781 stop:2611 length:831 start_codon:yes stop_codon:yes gene_type:complete